MWAGPSQLFLLLVPVLQLVQEEWVVSSANKGGLQEPGGSSVTWEKLGGSLSRLRPLHSWV